MTTHACVQKSILNACTLVVLVLVSLLVGSSVAIMDTTSSFRMKTIAGSNFTSGIPAIYAGLGDNIGGLHIFDGEIFFSQDNIVRMIGKNGIIKTIAGNSRTEELGGNYEGIGHANLALFE